MLGTEKLSKAFLAIIEEAEKAQKKNSSGKVNKRLQTIVSIAKHQSDIRGLAKGKCKASHKKCK
ncbi:MAG: hypothetical protein JRJ68_01585 [Deltaproteobacteria bacterium]|nr:hypothetical protein [Deltaproteobacteria bacterium]